MHDIIQYGLECLADLRQTCMVTVYVLVAIVVDGFKCGFYVYM